jgi:hypothetical protein
MQNDNDEKIEENICNMLEKILIDEEDFKSVDVMSTVDCTTRKNSQPYNFVRGERQHFSNIEKKPKNILLRVYGDYDSMYEVQRSRLHQQKKFLTISPNKLATQKLLPSIFGEGFHIKECENRESIFSKNGSDVVENFICQKYEELNIEVCERFRGTFSTLITNQNSCRILQNLLSKSDHFSISKLFWEIIREIDSLIVNPYGNYFCQKFYQLLNFDERIAFLIQIRKNIMTISNSNIGTYPLQSIVEKLATSEEMVIISEVFRNELIFNQVSTNPYGVHVIEKMIGCFPEELIFFIYEHVLNNFILLANQSTGLIMVKKVISSARNQLYINRIQFLIINNFNLLIQNPFGNYTLQVALEVNIN